MNLETIIDIHSWCRTWPPNGSSRIRAKQRLHRRRRVFESSSSRRKDIYTDSSLEFGKSCEDLSWNHRTSTPHRSETNGIAERAVRLVDKRNFLQYCCNQDWMKDGGMILLNAIAIFEMPNTSWQMGKLLMKGFKGAMIPLGAMSGYYLIFGRDKSRLHQSRENLERRYFGGRHGRNREDRRIGNSHPTNQRKIIIKADSRNSWSLPINFARPSAIGKNPTESRDDGEVWKDFWSIQGDFIYRHHNEPRVQLYVPKDTEIH